MFAQALMKAGRLEEAAEVLREAERLGQRLVQEHPADIELAGRLGRVLDTSGEVAAALGDRSAAERYYRSAVAIHARRAASSKTGRAREQLAAARYRLGLALRRRGDPDAVGQLREAWQILSDLRASDQLDRSSDAARTYLPALQAEFGPRSP
jgi:tetratricopeptide (TPR) repeat protein